MVTKVYLTTLFKEVWLLGAEDTLPAEIWDSRLGPIFWEKFLESWPDKLFDDDMKTPPTLFIYEIVSN
jgi:hypothetical protein